MLMEIEILGVKINQERAQELAVSARKEMGILVDRLGFDVGKKAELAHRLYAPKKDGGLGFSLQGVPLSKLSSKEFGTMPVMDKHVLAQYDHPVTADVLQYRGLQKAESTWFQGFLDKLWPDGRLHPNYRQDGTVTTRLSCAGPNMQQLPRVREEEIEQNVTKKLVKTMLDVDPSYELWGYDYSQLEYRIAAVYSKEKVLIDAYKSGSDFHRVSQEKFGLDRPSAKILNFSILYGAGGARVGAQLGIGASAGVELVKEFWGQYPKLAKVVKECEMLGLSRGWVRLYTGRKRHFRYPSECRKAFNSVVQGGAAEIVKESMLRVRRAGFKRTVGQVHDEIWYEFDKGADHSEFVKLLEWPEERFLIPFTVEGHKIAG